MVDHMVDHMVVDRLGKNGLEDDDKVGLINWVNHFKCWLDVYGGYQQVNYGEYQQDVDVRY